MKLYEFEGKSLFRKAGIPVPEAAVVADSQSAIQSAANLGFPVAVKSQVLSGGRGKRGGIRFAHDADQLESHVDAMLGRDLGEEKVTCLLIEKCLAVAEEFYLGVTFEPQTAMPLMILSAQGGVDIETVARSTPDRIIKVPLDPLQKPETDKIKTLAAQAGITDPALPQVAGIMKKLVEAYFRFDAVTAEINPLVIDDRGTAWAADAKMEIDDSALYRQTEIFAFERPEETRQTLESEARAAGVSYVRLRENGNIGLIAGGAGVGMATMDTVYHYGGIPANFLDLGGIATPEKTAAALKIVLKTPGVEGVFLNAFGGINNCLEMAQGVVRVVEELNPPQTITVKMRGHSQDEGWALLEEKNIPIVKYGTTGDGIALLLEEMKKKGATTSGHIDS